MSLSAGLRLGPYEILGLIGAGGMGEVYRARDARLGRDVAVKVLPSVLAADPARRQRFEREARAISALEHPNICALHDIGSEAGIDYLVMEYITGETLADRLKKGALPFAQALKIGVQIAEALDAAHTHGVIHRDIKPGNIMIAKAGVKLLDFGLARLKEDAERPGGAQSTSAPTQVKPLTGDGVVLGTLPYMAPEQLEGKQADARTDIWALGAILHEMLAGRRAFEGSSSAGLVAAILEREPAPLSELQPLTPTALDHLVRRCLAKDPANRWDTAHDVANELRWIADTPLERVQPVKRRQDVVRSILTVGPVVLASVAIGGLVTAFFMRSASAPSRLSQRWVIALPPGEFLGRGSPGRYLAVSRDGALLVYGGETEGKTHLYVRPIGQLESRLLAETEGASHPFFSPDARWVGFIANGKLRKVPLTGGGAVTLADIGENARGATWTEGDTILFAVDEGKLMAVSAAGGAPRVVAEPERANGETGYRWPEGLPGGGTALVTIWRGSVSTASVAVVALETGRRRNLLNRATNPVYATSGHLLFARGAAVFAVPFDPKRQELRSEPVPVVQGVLGFSGGVSNFTVADTGLLAFVRGEIAPALAWVERDGKSSPIRVGRWAGRPRLSPDGQRIAIELASAEGDIDIWIHESSRDALSRFTTGGTNCSPTWSPDGNWLAFSSDRAGGYDLYRQRTDFSGELERLLERDGDQFAEAFSADGRALFFSEEDPTSGRDVWLLPVSPAGTPSRVLGTPFRESQVAPSPDGRSLVYVSDESGHDEVYLRRFPGPGGRIQISNHGGAEPAWDRTGRQLCYLVGVGANVTFGQRTLFCVSIASQPTLRAGAPRMLFQYRGMQPQAFELQRPGFDISPDGEKFLMLVPPSDPVSMLGQVIVVLNWFGELKSGAPTGQGG